MTLNQEDAIEAVAVLAAGVLHGGFAVARLTLAHVKRRHLDTTHWLVHLRGSEYQFINFRPQVGVFFILKT